MHDRIRTMSMNLYLGGFAPNSRAGSGDDPGTDGNIPFAKGFCIYNKLSDLNGGMPSPGPAKTWVFLDQREDRINWGNYMTDMTGFPDKPAQYEFDQDMPGFYIPFAKGFCIYNKLSDLNGGLPSPGPAKTWVFLDQREDRINGGNYMPDMTGFPDKPAQYEFDQDMPGFYHHFAAGFSFADGHSEIHRWKDARTTPPLNYDVQITSKVYTPRDIDVAWLQDHTVRPKNWSGD